MKLKRSITTTVLLVVLAICVSILLNGCASTGKGKNSEPVTRSSAETGKQSVAAEQSSGISPEVAKEPVAYRGTGPINQSKHVQDAGLKPGKEGFKQYAASLRQALYGILPEKLSELNWNRITTILVGLLILFTIYGLAFALGRLPARKQRAGRHGGAQQIVEQAGGSVPQ
jgi:hypothetical protein